MAASPLIYLFGLPGAGKNFVGEMLRDEWGMQFADADEWLLDDMKQSLARGEGFTPEQRDRYYASVAARIGQLKAAVTVPSTDHPGGISSTPTQGLAIAQATFKTQHRRLVAAAHPEVQLWWVRAAESDRMMRLQKGGNRVDTVLGRKMRSEFEAPQLLSADGSRLEAADCHAVIDSGTVAFVRSQIEAQLGRPPASGGALRPEILEQLPTKADAPLVWGVGLRRHGESRCAHWNSELDVLAIQAPCCQKFYACASCHDACENHSFNPWPSSTSLEQNALLCGVCRHSYSIREYINGTESPSCPACGASMNPGCKLHWCVSSTFFLPPPRYSSMCMGRCVFVQDTVL